ncbi:MAG: hypothetical protein V1661_03500 [bacterium]
MGEIKKEILKALAFYDIFKYPLTGLEIFRNLGIVAGLEEVLPALAELKNENMIMETSGFFYLPQEKNLAAGRKARFLISSEKLKRAKKIAKILSFIPQIKFIGICNSLGFLNADGESDIDFFIIARKNRLWLARFLAVSFAQIFKLRPSGQTAKDGICLSFFIDENNLDISNVVLPAGDPYFYRWMSWIMPLYDGGIYEKFISANGWIKNKLPNFLEQNADLKSCGPSALLRTCGKKSNGFFLGDWLERMAKKIQLRIMPKELADAAKNRQDKSVVISDAMLKFHLSDRREEYREKFYEKIKFLNDQIPNPNGQSKNQ